MSTKSWEDSLRKMAKDKQLKMLSKKDKESLIKIANLMKRANEGSKVNERMPYKGSFKGQRKTGDNYKGGYSDNRGNRSELYQAKNGTFYIWIKSGGAEAYMDLPKNIKDRDKADDIHLKLRDNFRSKKPIKVKGKTLKPESVREATVYQFKGFTNKDMDELDATLSRNRIIGTPDFNKMTWTVKKYPKGWGSYDQKQLDYYMLKSKRGKKISEALDPYKDFGTDNSWEKEYDLNLGSFVDHYQKFMKFVKKYKEVPDKNKRAWAHAIRKKVGQGMFNGHMNQMRNITDLLQMGDKYRKLKDEAGYVYESKKPIKESTDVFDYNEIIIEQLIDTVQADARSWMRTTAIMENKHTYTIVKKALKTFEKQMKNLGNALKRLPK